MNLTVHSIKYLQAISSRIHYGKFVAEVKFRDAPQDYEPLIRAKVYIYIYVCVDCFVLAWLGLFSSMISIIHVSILWSFYNLSFGLFTSTKLHCKTRVFHLSGKFLQDREGVMKLLTFTDVEETVRKRVEKKATVFGQEVSLDSNNDGNGKRKFDPTVASRLYKNWMIPLTKEIEVEYLLRRLD